MYKWYSSRLIFPRINGALIYDRDVKQPLQILDGGYTAKTIKLN